MMKWINIIGYSFWTIAILLWFITPMIIILGPMIYPLASMTIMCIMAGLKTLAESVRGTVNPSYIMEVMNRFHLETLKYRVIESKPLNLDSESYLFPSHPHGVFTIGTIMFYCWLWTRKIKLSAIVAPTMLWLPVINLFLGVINAYSAKKVEFKARLSEIKRGCSLVWLPGGFEDVVNMEESNDTITVPKGWVKYALQAGCRVVPTYHLGEHQTYYIIPLPFRSWRRSISKQYQFPCLIPWFWGQSGSPVPQFNPPIVTLIGSPINFPTITNPTNAQIAKWHRLYCKELLALVNRYKDTINPSIQLTILD